MKVTLVEYTPNPDNVCGLAARTCVSKTPFLDDMFTDLSHEAGLKSAMNSGHDSVLEHASFTFYVYGISRACSHQLVRHRMASYAQQSQRYVRMENFDYVVPHSILDSSKDINSNGAEVCFIKAMERLKNAYNELVEAYHIPKEDARYLLPNACCTNILVTMNGRELKHFLELRMCSRAQWEIRELAENMAKLAKEVAPLMFADAGPRCEKLGYCPEERGCGRYPKKE